MRCRKCLLCMSHSVQPLPMKGRTAALRRCKFRGLFYCFPIGEFRTSFADNTRAMSNSSTNVTLHPQLSHPNFRSNFTDNDDLEDEPIRRDRNEAPVAPAQEEEGPQTVRVGRPVPPIDYGPQPPLLSVRELMDLALR